MAFAIAPGPRDKDKRTLGCIHDQRYVAIPTDRTDHFQIEEGPVGPMQWRKTRRYDFAGLVVVAALEFF